MEFSLEALLYFAVMFGCCMSFVFAHLCELSKKDKELRYADPKEWQGIWFILAAVFVIHCILLSPTHPDWLFGSLMWIVIVYLLAKLPFCKVMGGQDARVLISAGLLFPHWFTIPVALVVALGVMSVVRRKKLSEEELADWKARGIPMVPFLTVGWVVSALFFAFGMCLY